MKIKIYDDALSKMIVEYIGEEKIIIIILRKYFINEINKNKNSKYLCCTRKIPS